MQKQTLKKYSILGLVLVAASAVTAAVLPSSTDDHMAGFSLTYSGPGVTSTLSCMATDDVGGQECIDETVSVNFLGAFSGSTDHAYNLSNNTADGGIANTTD